MKFANEGNAKRRYGLLIRIHNYAIRSRIFALVEEFEKWAVTEDMAAEYHAALEEKLNHSVEFGYFENDFSGRITWAKGLSGSAYMRLPPKDQGDLVNLLSFLLYIVGFKGIKKCPACNKFFIVYKYAHQVTCDRTCKTRLRRKKMSDEEKAALNKKRVKEYKNKVLNGGKK